MYEKIAFGAITMFLILMFLYFRTFASGYSSCCLPKPDKLTQKEFSVYGNLDCNNPNVTAGFVWNYSDFFTPKEQCDSYVYADEINAHASRRYNQKN